MKVLTSAEMREVDRRTIEAGIPGIVLMENAAHRVVEAMAERFAPLGAQRIVVLCGKGNNGGDGLAIARQLHTRFRPAALDVVLLGQPEELKGDAAANYRMLLACGGTVVREIPARARMATLGGGCAAGHGPRGAGDRAHAGRNPGDQWRLSAGEGRGGGHSFGAAERLRRRPPGNSRART